METRSGGRELIEKLEKLRHAMQEYYGMINELKNGLKPSVIAEKPDILEIMDICTEMGINRVDADYEHQPYLWMLEYMVCLQEKNIFKNLSSIGNTVEQSNNVKT